MVFVGAVLAAETPATRARATEQPLNMNSHARKVLTAVVSGNLPELQQAYAEKPLEFSQPGVGAMLLNFACREGRPEIVEWLLHLGCDPNEPYLNELPLVAAVDWDSTTMKQRLTGDPTVMAIIGNAAKGGRTALTTEELRTLSESGVSKRLAEQMFRPVDPEILVRKTKVVDHLLANGAEVRATAGAPLVVRAVRTGFDGTFVHRLADAGADLTTDDPNFHAAALHVAAYQGNLSAATALLDRGLRLDTLSFPLPANFPNARLEPSGGGNTPLMCAIVRGQVAMVRLLLDRGADPNQTNRHLCTALHFAAARREQHEIVSLLLAHQARPNAASLFGITPLHFAAISGDLPTARLLCDAGAALEVADAAGYTAFLWAVEKDQAEMLEFLLSRGANRRAVTDGRLNAMQVAAMLGALHSIEFLLAHGDPVEGFPNNTSTPLQEAAASGQVAAVKLLLTRGAHPDRVAHSSSFSPPLVAVVRALAMGPKVKELAEKRGAVYGVIAPDEGRCTEVVRLLLDAGATIDVTDQRHETALHIAAENDFRQVAAVLLEHGARTDLANSRGLTPHKLAVKQGRREIAEMIERRDGAPVR